MRIELNVEEVAKAGLQAIEEGRLALQHDVGFACRYWYPCNDAGDPLMINGKPVGCGIGVAVELGTAQRMQDVTYPAIDTLISTPQGIDVETDDEDTLFAIQNTHDKYIDKVFNTGQRKRYVAAYKRFLQKVLDGWRAQKPVNA